MGYLNKDGLTYLWSKIKEKIPTKLSELTNDSGFVTSDHTHDASDIASGSVPIARGGTGASDAATARANLGAAAESHTHAAGDITSGTFAADRYADKGITRSKLADDARGVVSADHSHSLDNVFNLENNGKLICVWSEDTDLTFEITKELTTALPDGFTVSVMVSGGTKKLIFTHPNIGVLDSMRLGWTDSDIVLSKRGEIVTFIRTPVGSAWIANYSGSCVRSYFTSVSVASSDFVSDTTYTDFPYRASVALNGVTSSMFPEVVFSVSDAMSGVFAPAAQTYDGGVYIYANAQKAVTIPTILAWR